MYEDLLIRKEELTRQIEKGTGLTPEMQVSITEEVHDIERILAGDEEEVGSGDPLIDKWEAQLARGETPDLTEGMENAKQ
jgi:hypothetical protein